MARRIPGAVIWLTLIAALAAGCAGPKDALQKYLDALNQGDYVQAYGYISSQDKEVKDFQKFMSESSSQRAALILALADKVSYRIISVQKSKGQAELVVEMVNPDYAAVSDAIFGPDYSSPEKAGKEKIERMIAQTYGKQQLPMVKATRSFTLLKEDGGWKVFLNWEKESRVDGLIAQAQELERAGNLQPARDKYAEALQADNGNALAQAKVKELEERMSSVQEDLAYASNIVFGEVRVEPAVVGGMGVFAEIKNKGGRSLKMVELVITFLGKKKQPLAEQVFRPIEAVPGVTKGENSPLLPGQARQFGLRVENPPPGWTKKVSIRVNNLEFAE